MVIDRGFAVFVGLGARQGLPSCVHPWTSTGTGCTGKARDLIARGAAERVCWSRGPVLVVVVDPAGLDRGVAGRRGWPGVSAAIRGDVAGGG